MIADIPNATIPEEFSQADPIEGIALVEVTGLPGDRVRVAITGTDAPPVVEVRSDGQQLVFGVGQETATAGADEEDEAIRLTVTAATRFETSPLDVPQSIQVIPQEVIESRGGGRITLPKLSEPFLGLLTNKVLVSNLMT